jgi:hypothetical protein
MKSYIATAIFFVLGTIFLYKDMSMHHMHGNTLLGIGEMTWMWYSMAVVHLLTMCKCKHCRNK